MFSPAQKETVSEMIRRADFSAIADYLNERFQPVAPVSADWVRSVGRPNPVGEWSDGTLVAWFQRRLSEGGLLHSRALAEQRPEELSFETCRFHIGFLNFEETPEMLERLRKDEPPEREDEAPVARSQIFVTNQVVQPIDSVAYKVAPKPSEL